MLQPRPPLIVADGADLTFHANLLDAQNAIEPDDIRMSEIKVWDADGNVFDVVVESDGEVRHGLLKSLVPRNEWIRLENSAGRSDREGLQLALRAYIAETNRVHIAPGDVAELSLTELLRLAQLDKR